MRPGNCSKYLQIDVNQNEKAVLNLLKVGMGEGEGTHILAKAARMAVRGLPGTP